MLFSKDILQYAKNQTNVPKQTKKMNERSHSFYLDSLRYLSENAEEIRSVIDRFQTSYHKMSESLFFKLEQLNPKNVLLSQIGQFRTLYDKLYQDFVITKLGNDEAILMYRENIESYTNPIQYKNTLYMYTNLGENTTYTSFKNEINTILCDLVRDLKYFTGYKHNTDSFRNCDLGEKRVNEYNDEIAEIYRSALGLDYAITKGELGTELYHHFRQGKLSENGLVPPSSTQRILTMYLSLDKIKPIVTRQQKRMIQATQELEETIRELDFTKYIRSNFSEEESKSYLLLIETAIRKIGEVCNLYLQIFGAWIDSIHQENYCYEYYLKEALRVIKEEDSQTMVSMEDYLFNYDIYLAEQELFDSFMRIQGSSIIKEVSLTYINESTKDTIMRYINKISTAIEGAWNKFKQTVMRDVDKKYLESIRDKMQNPNPKFTISNFPTYNTARLDDIKLIPFDYAEMKESLESKKSFLEKYYPNLAQSDKSTIETIEGLTITGRQNTRCTPELLKSMYNFAINEFERKIQNIETDLKTVNTSNKNIQQLANQITQGTTTTPATPAQEENENKQNQAENQEGGNNVGYKDDETQATKDNSSLIKQISNYVGASTDILSAKMKIYRDIYALYMKTLRHYTRSEDKKQQAQKQQQAQEPKKPQVEQPKTQVTI